MGEGEFALVRQHLEMATGGGANWLGDHDVYSTLVDAAALQRDEAGIRAYAPTAEALAVRYDHKLYRAIAHRAWGVAHRLAKEFADGERRLNQAYTLFAELGARWQIGRTWFERGELALADGREAEAREAWGRALADFEAMRAAPDAARARAALEALPLEIGKVGR